MTKDNKNVMLLAMSTLPKDVICWTYEYQSEKYRFEGYSQLEAGTKLIIKKLKEENEKIDKIVVLSTYATNNVIEDYTKEKLAALNEAAGTHFEIETSKDDQIFTANNFYKERINNYTKELEVITPEFVFVNVERSTFITEIVDAICGTGEDNVSLYVDVQGGHRPTITKMMAILELLKGRNVVVKERIAIKFNPKRDKNEPQPIHIVDEEYETYELVTAMEVFRRYGSGRELQEYFDKKLGKNEKLTKKLTKFIMNASEAIQTCDVGAFDAAIVQVADLAEEFETRSKEEKEEIDVVFKDIYDDYRTIIEAKYRYVEQIRWCLKKNYIQQAITILEAKMPGEYVRNGLKFYSWENGGQTELLNYFEEILKKKKEDTKKKKSSKKNIIDETYKMKDINHYFIKYYEKEKEQFKNDSFEVNYGADIAQIEKNIIKYRTLCNRRNAINHANSQKKAGGFYETVYKKYDNRRQNEQNSISQLRKDVEKYLLEFEALANKVPPEKIQAVIDLE